ncbi:centrosomal protein of 44 kDa isoform X1 [Cebidichthys violaceus]|uniref:centrosomal protein of 44 kDa isoform X1 n=2 Tax=Cebidichthys violaceus TaxID=271503 RepID=UPI0035C9803E
MQSTGDVQGCLRKLETLLRAIKYPGYVDYNGLSKGDPSAFLPIVSFTLTSFSPPFAKQLMEAGLELTGKTDLRFTDTLYKVLRDIFHYKPILTKQQFLQCGFSQRKISVICDIINLVLKKHNQLKKPRVRCPASHKDDRGEAHPTLTDADTVSERPFFVNRVENSSTFPKNSSNAEEFSSHDVTCTSHNEVYSSNSPGNGITELAGREEDKDNILYSSEVEGRLSALEAQLGSLLSGMVRLNILEKLLEKLDKHRITNKNEGEVITISRESWENLMSRVLLLETKLDLSNIQLSVPLPCPSSASSSSCTMSDASKEDLKDRLERITSMLKSTSSLLKNTSSSTTLQMNYDKYSSI